MGVRQHGEGVAGRKGEALGHELGHLLPGGLFLQVDHRVEDAANEPLDDVRVIVGEIGSGKPHVGDELVRRGGRDEHAVPLHVGEVVDVRSPAHYRRNVPIRVERRRRLERILGKAELHISRLQAPVDQGVQQEEVGRRVLRENDGLPSKVGNRTDVLPDHDPIPTIRPVHLLIHPGHGTGVAAQALDEKGNHVEGGPPDVNIPGGVSVPHGYGVIDENQVELEVLAGGRRPDLPRI